MDTQAGAVSRPVEIDGAVYRSHAVTEIRHVVGGPTTVSVRSHAEEGGGGFYVERSFEREYDDSLSLADACEWVFSLPEFEEVVDERELLIAELAPTLTDEQAARVPWAYAEWSAGDSYAQGDRVSYLGGVYRCLQAHDAQEAWTPADAPSLWAGAREQQPAEGGEGEGPAEPTYHEWQQPDSTNPYMAGERVTFQDAVYESTIDNNVWSPSDYPQGWTLVEQADESETDGEEGAE